MSTQRAVFSAAAAVAFLLLGLPGTALAQPAISGASGTWTHKSAVTVAGAGFGSKPTATPLVWDDASASDIRNNWTGAWPDCAGNAAYNLNYRTPLQVGRGVELPHSHITKYIAGAHNPGTGFNCGYNVMMFKNRTITLPSYSYLAWYERTDGGWRFGDDDNFKTFAYASGTTPYEPDANWYIEYNPRPTSTTSDATWHVNDVSGSMQSPDLNGNSWWWGAAINPMSGSWQKIELEIKHTNLTDGYIRQWENGVLKINYAGATDKMAGTMRTLAIGGYARMYGFATQWRYFADVYLDTTRARVILGNAATLSASTIREVQIPTAWSNTSITLSANLGKFSNAQTAYLYVVDANGNVNAAGFPVVLASSTPDTTAPAITMTAPANGASGVTAATDVLVTFSEPMNASTVSTSTIELRSAANALVSGTVSYDATTRVATFNPSATLAAGATYTATVRGGAAGVKDAAGNALAANYSWSFVTSLTAPPPTNGPVVALGFEETSGVTATDSSGWANTGVISGATRVSGRYGNGLQFDGVDDWVTVLDAASLDLTSGMTLEAWVRPTALSGWRTVVMKEAAGGLAYALYAHDDNPWPAAYIRRTASAASDAAGGTSALALNTWTHLAATYDGTTLRLFVNGTEARAVAAAGTILASSNALHIGGNAVWAEFFTGLIDEVRIYNRALTAAEIQTDMGMAIAPGAPSDTTAPTVLSVAPGAAATGVGPAANITATFSEAMLSPTVGSATVELRAVATNALVAAVVTYNSSSRVVTLDPAASLAAGTQYRATVVGGAAGVKDASGNAMAANYTWTFTTATAPAAPTNLRIIR